MVTIINFFTLLQYSLLETILNQSVCREQNLIKNSNLDHKLYY